jgi:hypothetical protein
MEELMNLINKNVIQNWTCRTKGCRLVATRLKRPRRQRQPTITTSPEDKAALARYMLVLYSTGAHGGIITGDGSTSCTFPHK